MVNNESVIYPLFGDAPATTEFKKTPQEDCTQCT